MIIKIISTLCLLLPISVNAQIHFNLNVQNMHLWRGIQVADGLVMTSNVSVTDPNNNFKVGLWGGTNTAGTYKEFNNYVAFAKKGFSLSIFDVYNFSDGATYNNTEFFNYKARETGRFLDAIVGYRFQGEYPLLLFWSTILFGRDRNASNTSNKYSTFYYAEYPIYKKDNWWVDLGVGGAFALKEAGDRSHFYGKNPGIVEVSLRLSRSLVIGDYTIPLSIHSMWNPEENRGNFQITLTLISL